MIDPTVMWAVAAAAVATFVLTALVRRWAMRNAVLDRPNERSSHSIPTPRGGGLAIMAAALPLLATVGGVPPAVIGGTVLLAAVGLADDLYSLPVGPRIAAQACAVAAALIWAISPTASFPFSVPAAAAAAVIGLGWMWFVNLYNFMDGIDGISGVETISICAGVALLGWLSPEVAPLVPAALLVGAAAVGFLAWNWHPAKIFLGDVGSLTLGFLCGYLLLALAAAGEPAAAFLLASYYLADATLTLVRRALRGEKVWQAHKEHFYQRAHQRGLSHSAVSLHIAGINVALIGCAAAATLGYTPVAIAAAIVLLMLFLVHLQGGQAPS